MSSASVSIKHILNMLALQTSRSDEVTIESIDVQFMSLMKVVERYFMEHEYELLFDWLNELMKKEVELKKKQEENFRVYKKDSINLLICKVNMFSARIIEMLIDEIDVAYQDYIEMKESNPEFAGSIKANMILMANNFINHLTENRSIDEAAFDQYIILIEQALQIFTM